MDLLMKFPDEATALEVGKRYGLYVQVSDGEPTVETYTELVEQPVMEKQEVEVQVPVLDENLSETGEFTAKIRLELVQVIPRIISGAEGLASTLVVRPQ